MTTWIIKDQPPAADEQCVWHPVDPFYEITIPAAECPECAALAEQAAEDAAMEAYYAAKQGVSA